MLLWYICIHYHVTIITWNFNFEAYFRRWSWACRWCCRCYAALWLHLVEIRFIFIVNWLYFRCILHYLIEIGLKAEFAAQCWLLIGWWSFGLIWRNGRIFIYRYLIWAFINFLNMYKGHMSIFVIYSAKSFITNLAFEWSFLGMDYFVVFQMGKAASKCSKYNFYEFYCKFSKSFSCFWVIQISKNRIWAIPKRFFAMLAFVWTSLWARMIFTWRIFDAFMN